ncbi:helix-turn-helix transcriptional regulator [Mesorhizobium sp. BAC0120]|uniref:AraC family transcriptional regulator n=1 Tax=Mesorhizobium sp. BAC0120 TaxID=3090670 RepID=UPI00298CBE94|nr:helix-turn-helix transcriptional regulator [Mesorhizobium sp. BAC0120]MDW6024723.1 helix-turn-helix transcriptional regulator [Mesorhizobium sp. BAC0120]
MSSVPFPLRRLSTEDVSRRERLSFVHDFLARHVGGRELAPSDPDNVRIDIEAMSLPSGLTVGRGFYAPISGARTRELLRDGREHYLLLIHNQDHEISVDGKAPFRVAAGDVMLLNEGTCHEFFYNKPTTVNTVTLDRHIIADLAPRLELEASYLIPSAADGMPLLANYVETLRRHPPVSAKAGDMAARHVYDLTALVLDGFVRGGAARNEHSKAAARRRLMRQDILQNLSDPGLNIDTIAHRQGVTPRYIQRLFEREGTTFTEFVRDSRLDLAFRLLKERDADSNMITAIAYDVGFSDLSTFSRAFRRRFNATPSQIRRSSSEY